MTVVTLTISVESCARMESAERFICWVTKKGEVSNSNNNSCNVTVSYTFSLKKSVC